MSGSKGSAEDELSHLICLQISVDENILIGANPFQMLPSFEMTVFVTSLSSISIQPCSILLRFWNS
ncbi:hypothetical protein SERLA73DRAFT_141190 [Serpula lacrymans var. lacrymans S7.3]|uniref:Uncharacterized protein n=1 Tax=Serpula lacrymans var. lacrymans (strain S7.3) TaxID=936435 RepID=F8Q615_SERL3|nr:hypothetical protein SERLA73DRAFT_141190 [Serpula lacrymans var. lacrymans S7.3]